VIIVSSLFEMEVGIEESNYEYELWIWKVKVVYIMLLLWKVKLSLRKCEVARRRRPIGRLWTRLQNTEENRAKHSWYNTILKEAAMHDQVVFFNITRMTPTTFEDLLLRLGTVQSLHKKDTKYRKRAYH
jgi:hypothetical protein